MRRLILILSVLVSASAHADMPLLKAPPLVAPATDAAAPVGGLRASVAPELTCVTCVSMEVVGVATFALGYLGAIPLWLHSEDVISHPTSGAWVAALFVPLFQVAALSELVPVVGPVLGATLLSDGDPHQQTLAWIDAGVQAAGLTLAAIGSMSQNQWQKEHRITVVPLVHANASGLSVGGTF